MIDDMITDERLDKQGQSLLELAISGKHRNHYLWLLKQSYFAIPKNLRRQARAVLVWYPNEMAYLRMIHDENNVLTNDELFIVRYFLKTSKHACFMLYEINIPVDLR